MPSGLIGLLGGVGLFLFGMGVMTAALTELAGARLRRVLARATATPLRAMLAGTVVTAGLQSSTAVSVMAIGFVGAGVLSFPQALGVLYGANIGSTMTGWLVTLVGVKLQLGTVAMPVLFVASLTLLLAGDRMARVARLVAGLSLVFIGLEGMQGAMAGAEALISPADLPADGLWGRVVLVVIGTGLSMLLQSSNTGLALAVVLLGAGAITLAQGAALVIGLNIGTTFTGLLAAVGGSRGMRMTALANLLLNLGTALVLFPLLGPLIGLGAVLAQWMDAQTLLVVFHSVFNLLGSLMFLPLTRPFAALVGRLVPQRGGADLAEALDRRLMADPGTALDAATRTGDALATAMARALQTALTAPDGPQQALRDLPVRIEPALTTLEDWLADMPMPPGPSEARQGHAALMHLTDHLRRLLARCAEVDRIRLLAEDPTLLRGARAMTAALAGGLGPVRMARLEVLVQRRAHSRRHALFLVPPGTAATDVFHRTDALRWLERVADHAERIAHYRAVATAAGR